MPNFDISHFAYPIEGISIELMKSAALKLDLPFFAKFNLPTIYAISAPISSREPLKLAQS